MSRYVDPGTSFFHWYSSDSLLARNASVMVPYFLSATVLNASRTAFCANLTSSLPFGHWDLLALALVSPSTAHHLSLVLFQVTADDLEIALVCQSCNGEGEQSALCRTTTRTAAL